MTTSSAHLQSLQPAQAKMANLNNLNEPQTKPKSKCEDALIMIFLLQARVVDFIDKVLTPTIAEITHLNKQLKDSLADEKAIEATLSGIKRQYDIEAGKGSPSLKILNGLKSQMNDVQIKIDQCRTNQDALKNKISVIYQSVVDAAQTLTKAQVKQAGNMLRILNNADRTWS